MSRPLRLGRGAAGWAGDHHGRRTDDTGRGNSPCTSMLVPRRTLSGRHAVKFTLLYRDGPPTFALFTLITELVDPAVDPHLALVAR